MARLPLMLDVTGVACLVVGAGTVAERKVRLLRSAGARLCLVAPAATPYLRGLARRKVLRWRRRSFRRGDLRGARLVLAATSDRVVNRSVAREAGRRRLFVNVADDRHASTFQMPALLRRGALVVAISSSGTGPGASRALRDDLARRLGAEYATYLSILGRVRARLWKGEPDATERRRRLRAALRAPILSLLLRGKGSAARRAAWRAAGLRPEAAR